MPLQYSVFAAKGQSPGQAVQAAQNKEIASVASGEEYFRVALVQQGFPFQIVGEQLCSQIDFTSGFGSAPRTRAR